MRKVTIITVLILVFFVQPAMAAKPPFTIQADDHVGFSQAKREIEAEGNVLITLKDGSIRADKVVISLAEKLVRAKGNVVLINGEQKVTGTALKYNYQTKTGQLFNSQTKQDRITFRGEVIKLKKDKMTIKDTSLTPCALEDPHYKLTAKEVKVYPQDKIIATGVWLWVKDYKLLPLPTYTVSLKEGTKQQTTSIPEPNFGYNMQDGAYMSINYDHYVNQDLQGTIYTKAATKGPNQLNLDYTYSPHQYLSFNPKLEYNQKFGLDSYLKLSNQLGPMTSHLKYNSYVIKDEDDAEYKERKEITHWQTTTKLKGLRLNTLLKQEGANKYLQEKFSVSKAWSDYYWKLESSRHTDIEYQPQFSLGIKNKQLDNGVLLSAGIKTGTIQAEKNHGTADLETTREQLNLSLKQDYKLTEQTKFSWAGQIVDATYGTGNNYRSYDFSAGLDRDLPFLQLGLNYNYYGDRGQTPFKFDDLITDALGNRHLISGSIGQADIKLTNNTELDWKVYGNRTFYETGEEYGQYGLNAGIKHQINEVNSLALDYKYRTLDHKSPKPATELDFVAEDELDLINQLDLTYNFQTDKGKFPYWDVEIKAGYDFTAEELAKLKYSVTREFDCFGLQFDLDQINKEANWRLNFKY
ncbi:organic solvent tolerance protein OstA [Halobacteroides halobius DSM 5150]|uniref:Organic solvent tolerance protein OstA n=1 Tax=Halobacteroides halobius (strain ATCC 35273 / DSM 5150 / MD-1) TaxID=748449 RepID=L0KB94_HALHC|nr:LptA/OstA family protein [Halobacteroides halobius]AGB42276.1 organic solvent tolerance protein OstA [Halobacteroides halobius DSM 5150]